LDEGAAPPALLLTDVGIPGMPGTELAVRLRARWPRLRVLYMSGYWTDGDARRELLDPALNVLQKPFERDELLLRVRALLEAPPAAGLT
jgi:two-component system, cell cycle sensor histidine kinase and response regulator CckA